ncbi:succinylglutamate desuccinylase [Kaistia algarum]|uniref:succinylglutamate desuccinylase/aspartoacylase family protein n=1 Tax=Kaistia algarum TaxID=2083279 RepID=UPI000CE8688B|nr:succinylglutamate desuccinylase/aspartoacylase family protein [Kaistia algarum]MCX5513946.1 succinylglutamate desuccinylase/aspartoacylase family protein [Kaistia algarum]PPE78078.1 succinylglutamate desuccinylase [Kaistia algarum]
MGAKAKQIGQCTVDFEKNGKQIGFFNLPLSVHDDAWGVVRVPLAQIKNGEGPTVILEGGNHGDEYEGPIALGEMIRDLDPGLVSGRLIFIPAINLPAVVAARRTSPIDDLNMNRTFPGDPRGTTTQQISAFVNDVLFPIGDAFLDLHSGGSSLDIIPSSVIEPVDDPVQHAKNIAAVTAFDAPMIVVIDNRGDPRTATASAARAGLTVVGTEMAGGGTVSLDAVRICRRGVSNVLAHLGALPASLASPQENEPLLYEIPGDGHVIAGDDGVFEPFHRNGETVRAGQPAGRIHFLADPGRAPVELHYAVDGIVYARRQPGRVRPGNCCLVVASPYRSSLS